jgi:outer membrane receptor protein involved in Fe transport
MLLSLFLAVSMAAAAVTGTVKDSTGGAVPGASVLVRTSAGIVQRTVTGPDGRFTLDKDLPPSSTIVVLAGGFAEKEVTPNGSMDIEIVLSPAAVFESVNVTPTRSEQRMGDVPASVAVLDSNQIRQSPAIVADDVLKQIPTFSLFRRTSSLVALPTAQGVSLRGIGPSGVSRTLVLIDDVPFNDPFGGWVYWTRVPLDNVDRIEVVEGPNSSLYGNYGMGGVINIVSARAAKRAIELKPQFGNLNTKKADLFGSYVYNKFSASLNGSWLDTDGFPIVYEPERGIIDNNAAVNYSNWNAKADYSFANGASAFFRVGHFAEDRDNAKVTTFAPTVEEGNNTQWTSTSAGVRFLLPDSSSLQARVFTDYAHFHSNFLAVPNLNTRAIGRLTLNQNVPSRSAGGMLQWGRAFGTRNYVTAGTDTRWVDGDSQEDSFDATAGQTIILHRDAGGVQNSVGAFVQDIMTPTDKLTLTLSARFDRWRNTNGHNFETNIPAGTPGAGNKPPLADGEDDTVSPHVAALYHVNERVSAWGGYSAGFRSPTLNELYRQFRVGARLVQANENLKGERLKGTELGVNLLPTNALSVRTVWFDNRITDPISNVTTVPPNTQQRQNLGKTRVRGVQFDATYRVNDMIQATAAYVYNDARVVDANGNTALVGNCQGIAGTNCFLAQVPKNRGSFRVNYANPKLVTLTFGMQFVGLQYEDDLNVTGVTVDGRCAVQQAVCANPGLPAYSTRDLTASRAITPNFEVFFGVQNLADTEYFVQTNPSTVGSPRLVNGGLRIRFSR